MLKPGGRYNFPAFRPRVAIVRDHGDSGDLCSTPPLPPVSPIPPHVTPLSPWLVNFVYPTSPHLFLAFLSVLRASGDDGDSCGLLPASLPRAKAGAGKTMRRDSANFQRKIGINFICKFRR